MKHWGLFRIAIAQFSILAASIALATLGLSSNARATALEETPTAHTDKQLLLAQTVLRPGAEGTRVKDIQAILSLMGYYSGPVNGTYGQPTVEAVQRFQTEVGLANDGVVGPATWQRLFPSPATLNAPLPSPQPQPQPTEPANSNEAQPPSTIDTTSVETAGNLPTLRLEDRGAAVQRLQSRLDKLNFYNGSIDGVFGEQTEQAVAAFQRQSGLEADGVVGPATWQKLLQ